MTEKNPFLGLILDLRRMLPDFRTFLPDSCTLTGFVHVFLLDKSLAHDNARVNQSIYTQTKKKRPIFIMLYLSIQVRRRNKNKNKMFIKRRTHKNGNYLIFIFLSWRVIEPNVYTGFSIIIRKLIIKFWHMLR